jgi:hypothetical protein
MWWWHRPQEQLAIYNLLTPQALITDLALASLGKPYVEQALFALSFLLTQTN